MCVSFALGLTMETHEVQVWQHHLDKPHKELHEHSLLFWGFFEKKTKENSSADFEAKVAGDESLHRNVVESDL